MRLIHFVAMMLVGLFSVASLQAAEIRIDVRASKTDTLIPRSEGAHNPEWLKDAPQSWVVARLTPKEQTESRTVVLELDAEKECGATLVLQADSDQPIVVTQIKVEGAAHPLFNLDFARREGDRAASWSGDYELSDDPRGIRLRRVDKNQLIAHQRIHFAANQNVRITVQYVLATAATTQRAEKNSVTTIAPLRFHHGAWTLQVDAQTGAWLSLRHANVEVLANAARRPMLEVVTESPDDGGNMLREAGQAHIDADNPAASAKKKRELLAL